MQKYTKNDIISFLNDNSETEYRQFSAKLLPNVKNILGIRLPILRKFAKEISKNDFQSFLKLKTDFFEEKMLKGFVIGYLKQDISAKFNYIADFIPQIDNWSVCDSFCSTMKIKPENQGIVWDFVTKYINSDKEFENRFAFVMLLNYFVDEKHIDLIFDILNSYTSDKYYAQMACAWLVSECFVKFPDKTFFYLKNNTLQMEIFKKSIRKIIESTAVSSAWKNKIKEICI